MVHAENANISPVLPSAVFGTDRHRGAVSAAQQNLETFSKRKNVFDELFGARAASSNPWYKAVDITHSNFQEFSPPVTPTLVVTNPPYGERIGDFEKLGELYESLGDFLKKKCTHPATDERQTKVFVLVGNKELAHKVHLQTKRKHIVYNNSIEARLLEFDLQKGAYKKNKPKDNSSGSGSSETEGATATATATTTTATPTGATTDTQASPSST